MLVEKSAMKAGILLSIQQTHHLNDCSSGYITVNRAKAELMGSACVDNTSNSPVTKVQVGRHVK